jgi:hypothetical protein
MRLEGIAGVLHREQPRPSLDVRQLPFRPSLLGCALCDAPGRGSGRRIPITRIVDIVDG